MKYTKGDVNIAIQQIDGFGNNPGLWIGTNNPNQSVKVASFGSEEKAKLFCKWLEYMFGVADRDVVRWDEHGNS